MLLPPEEFLNQLHQEMDCISIEKVSFTMLAGFYQKLGNFFHSCKKLQEKQAKQVANCCITFIEYIESYVENKRLFQPKEIETIKQFIQILGMISKLKGARDEFMHCTISRFFDIVVYSKIIFFRKEVLKNFNRAVENTNNDLRNKLAMKHLEYLCKLMDILYTCGDYEFQVILVETVFRMCSQDQIINYAATLFPESGTLQNALCNIKRYYFDRDVRQFLNIVNNKSKNMFSIKCDYVTLGNIHIGAPTDSDGKQLPLWIDFNFGPKTMTFLCNQNSLKTLSNSEDNDDGWETVTIEIANVKKVMVASLRTPNSGHSQGSIICFNVTEPCGVLYSSSLEAASATHLKVAIFECPELDLLRNEVLPTLFGQLVQHLSSSGEEDSPQLLPHPPPRHTTCTISKGYKPLKTRVSATSASVHHTDRSSSVSDAMSLKAKLLEFKDNIPSSKKNPPLCRSPYIKNIEELKKTDAEMEEAYFELEQQPEVKESSSKRCKISTGRTNIQELNTYSLDAPKYTVKEDSKSFVDNNKSEFNKLSNNSKTNPENSYSIESLENTLKLTENKSDETNYQNVNKSIKRKIRTKEIIKVKWPRQANSVETRKSIRIPKIKRKSKNKLLKNSSKTAQVKESEVLHIVDLEEVNKESSQIVKLNQNEELKDNNTNKQLLETASIKNSNIFENENSINADCLKIHINEHKGNFDLLPSRVEDCRFQNKEIIVNSELQATELDKIQSREHEIIKVKSTKKAKDSIICNTPKNTRNIQKFQFKTECVKEQTKSNELEKAESTTLNEDLIQITLPESGAVEDTDLEMTIKINRLSSSLDLENYENRKIEELMQNGCKGFSPPQESVFENNTKCSTENVTICNVGLIEVDRIENSSVHIEKVKILDATNREVELISEDSKSHDYNLSDTEDFFDDCFSEFFNDEKDMKIAEKPLHKIKEDILTNVEDEEVFDTCTQEIDENNLLTEQTPTECALSNNDLDKYESDQTRELPESNVLKLNDEGTNRFGNREIGSETALFTSSPKLQDSTKISCDVKKHSDNDFLNSEQIVPDISEQDQQIEVNIEKSNDVEAFSHEKIDKAAEQDDKENIESTANQGENNVEIVCQRKNNTENMEQDKEAHIIEQELRKNDNKTCEKNTSCDDAVKSSKRKSFDGKQIQQSKKRGKFVKQKKDTRKSKRISKMIRDAENLSVVLQDVLPSQGINEQSNFDIKLWSTGDYSSNNLQTEEGSVEHNDKHPEELIINEATLTTKDIERNKALTNIVATEDNNDESPLKEESGKYFEELVISETTPIVKDTEKNKVPVNESLLKEDSTKDSDTHFEELTINEVATIVKDKAQTQVFATEDNNDESLLNEDSTKENDKHFEELLTNKATIVVNDIEDDTASTTVFIAEDNYDELLLKEDSNKESDKHFKELLKNETTSIVKDIEKDKISTTEDNNDELLLKGGRTKERDNFEELIINETTPTVKDIKKDDTLIKGFTAEDKDDELPLKEGTTKESDKHFEELIFNEVTVMVKDIGKKIFTKEENDELSLKNVEKDIVDSHLENKDNQDIQGTTTNEQEESVLMDNSTDIENKNINLNEYNDKELFQESYQPKVLQTKKRKSSDDDLNKSAITNFNPPIDSGAFNDEISQVKVSKRTRGTRKLSLRKLYNPNTIVIVDDTINEKDEVSNSSNLFGYNSLWNSTTLLNKEMLHQNNTNSLRDADKPDLIVSTDQALVETVKSLQNEKFTIVKPAKKKTIKKSKKKEKIGSANLSVTNDEHCSQQEPYIDETLRLPCNNRSIMKENDKIVNKSKEKSEAKSDIATDDLIIANEKYFKKPRTSIKARSPLPNNQVSKSDAEKNIETTNSIEVNEDITECKYVTEPKLLREETKLSNDKLTAKKLEKKKYRNKSKKIDKKKEVSVVNSTDTDNRENLFVDLTKSLHMDLRKNKSKEKSLKIAEKKKESITRKVKLLKDPASNVTKNDGKKSLKLSHRANKLKVKRNSVDYSYDNKKHTSKNLHSKKKSLTIKEQTSYSDYRESDYSNNNYFSFDSCLRSLYKRVENIDMSSELKTFKRRLSTKHKSRSDSYKSLKTDNKLSKSVLKRKSTRSKSSVDKLKLQLSFEETSKKTNVSKNQSKKSLALPEHNEEKDDETVEIILSDSETEVRKTPTRKIQTLSVKFDEKDCDNSDNDLNISLGEQQDLCSLDEIQSANIKKTDDDYYRVSPEKVARLKMPVEQISRWMQAGDLDTALESLKHAITVTQKRHVEDINKIYNNLLEFCNSLKVYYEK